MGQACEENDVRRALEESCQRTSITWKPSDGRAFFVGERPTRRPGDASQLSTCVTPAKT